MLPNLIRCYKITNQKLATKNAEALFWDEIEMLKQKIASLKSDVLHVEGKIRIKEENSIFIKERVTEAKRTMKKCVADNKIPTQTIEQ